MKSPKYGFIVREKEIMRLFEAIDEIQNEKFNRTFYHDSQDLNITSSKKKMTEEIADEDSAKLFLT
jgi:hypothetical protein